MDRSLRLGEKDGLRVRGAGWIVDIFIAAVVVGIEALGHPGGGTFVRAKDGVEPIESYGVLDGEVEGFDGGWGGDAGEGWV